LAQSLIRRSSIFFWGGGNEVAPLCTFTLLPAEKTVVRTVKRLKTTLVVRRQLPRLPGYFTVVYIHKKAGNIGRNFLIFRGTVLNILSRFLADAPSFEGK
jgi:hypothetical protein